MAKVSEVGTELDQNHSFRGLYLRCIHEAQALQLFLDFVKLAEMSTGRSGSRGHPCKLLQLLNSKPNLLSSSMSGCDFLRGGICQLDKLVQDVHGSGGRRCSNFKRLSDALHRR